jgi:hypothetical protein
MPAEPVLCTAASRRLREPLAGSAPHALLWVLIEQPGPWGRDALTKSHLPDGIGAQLTTAAAELPVRLGLMRATGNHADVGRADHTVLVASTNPASPWLAKRRVSDLDVLTTFDFELALDAMQPPAGLPGEPVETPERMLLVCTNSRRDRCCATFGRPLSAALAAMAPIAVVQTEVWETSHLGGHRFAPTYVSLPDGYLFGGADAVFATTEACRGRTSLPPPAQVAELAVLRRHGEPTPRQLSVVEIDTTKNGSTQSGSAQSQAASRWRVRYDNSDDGHIEHDVIVERVEGDARPESCNRGPVPMLTWQATILP